MLDLGLQVGNTSCSGSVAGKSETSTLKKALGPFLQLSESGFKVDVCSG